MSSLINIFDVYKAIMAGIVEGLTEFIPVSSTAHLLLFSKISDFNKIANNLFEITIQLGAIMAICLIYHKKIFSLITKFNKNNRSFIINLILSFLPAAIFGLLFHSFIKEVLFSMLVIAIALIVGGIIMIIIEKKTSKAKIYNIDRISHLNALGIGFFQVLAMVPGVSRAGSTIIGAMLLKLDRKTATEFSFFLAIPTIFCAALYDLYKNFSLINFDNLSLIAIGFFSAFFSALLVIKWFINYVSNHNFIVFGIYRIILGIVILFFTI